MTYTEDTDGFLQDTGTIHYKYEYTTGNGGKFRFGCSIEDVPEELRERLEWLRAKMKVQLNELAIDLAVYLGDI